MKINITTNNIDLNNYLSNRINDRGGKIEKFITSQNEDLALNIEVSKDTNHHKNGEIFSAEYNLLVEGKLIRTTSTKETLDEAIDCASDEMIKRLRRGKSKWKDMMISGARRAKEILRRK